VVIVYEAWGLGRALVNGQVTNLPLGQWIRVGDGCTVMARDGSNAQFRYEFRNQVVSISIGRQDWPFGNFINVYVDAPWEWSSGRSMWGLCGDYDAWVGNDRIWIDRNAHQRFAVTNSANDFFRFPTRRTEVLIQEGNVGEKNREAVLDKANGVLHVSEFVEENAEVQAKMHADLAEAVFATTERRRRQNAEDETDVPDRHINLHGVSKAVIAKAEKHCGDVQKAAKSHVMKQCVFDVLNGMRGAAWVFGMANEKGHEKECKRCMHISAESFSLVGKDTLPAEESKEEGFSVALWYKPTDQTNDDASILERGTSALVVAQNGDDLKVSLGTNSCTCQHALPKDDWTSILVAVHRTNPTKVFVNRKLCCQVPLDLEGESFDEVYHTDLVIGGSGNSVAEGDVAHVFFMPSVVTTKLANLNGNVKPVDCDPSP